MRLKKLLAASGGLPGSPVAPPSKQQRPEGMARREQGLGRAAAAAAAIAGGGGGSPAVRPLPSAGAQPETHSCLLALLAAPAACRLTTRMHGRTARPPPAAPCWTEPHRWQRRRPEMRSQTRSRATQQRRQQRRRQATRLRARLTSGAAPTGDASWTACCRRRRRRSNSAVCLLAAQRAWERPPRLPAAPACCLLGCWPACPIFFPDCVSTRHAAAVPCAAAPRELALQVGESNGGCTGSKREGGAGSRASWHTRAAAG